jgi:Uma2 family endonuclease
MSNQTLNKITMSAEAYRMLSPTDERTELIEGELIVSASPVEKHQLVCSNTTIYLGSRLGARRLRYEMDLYIGGDNVPRPDIFWISESNTTCILKDGYWYGAPDFIVEVLSPSTARIDRGFKYQIYQRYGVREYWILDPEDLFLEVYNLENGRFIRTGFYERGDTFSSPVLNIEIHVDALFDGM